MGSDEFEQWGPAWHGHMFRGWHGFQAKRGDMGPILLRVLAEKPMHGYEIIRELEKKSHGLWRPSPGSVYPTLQLLEEQELVQSRDEAGKKVYHLTDAGRKEAEKAAESWQWHEKWHGKKFDYEKAMKIRGSVVEMMMTFKGVMRAGSEDQQRRALEVLEEAKAKMRAIVEDEPKK